MGTGRTVFKWAALENVTRDTAVEVSEYRETQEKMERLREKYEVTIQQLPQEQWQLILGWVTKLEDMNLLEGQKVYCQGYVDCILLLSGMGFLRQNLSLEEIRKWIR